MSVSAADKSKPYIPHNNLANDGWSKEDEATATCFCGAVQLAFVSLAPVSTRPSPHTQPAISHSPLTPLQSHLYHHQPHSNPASQPPPLANPSARPNQHLPLQLHRLPQNHRLHVRLQLHRRRHPPQTPPRPRQSQVLGPIADHRFGWQNDKSLLLHVRDAHVSCRVQVSGDEYSAHWDGGRFQFAWDEVEAEGRAVYEGSGGVVEGGGRGSAGWGERAFSVFIIISNAWHWARVPPPPYIFVL